MLFIYYSHLLHVLVICFYLLFILCVISIFRGPLWRCDYCI